MKKENIYIYSNKALKFMKCATIVLDAFQVITIEAITPL